MQKEAILPYTDQSFVSGELFQFMGVTSSYEQASQGGVHCLKKGGNAVDALVTTSILLTVVEPALSGIFGCGEVLISEVDGLSKVLNFSGSAPAAFDESFSGTLPLVYTTLTPTCVHAWEELLFKEGTISLQEACEPAIKLADSGFPATPEHLFFLQNMPEEKKPFLDPSVYTDVSRVGDWILQPKMAECLRAIQKEGSQGVVNGEIGKELLSTVKKNKGLLSKEDLIRIQEDLTWEAPLKEDVFGYSVEVPGPNCDAFVLLHMLKKCEEKKVDQMKPDTAEYIDTLVKIIYQTMTALKKCGGDPRFHQLDLALDSPDRKEFLGKKRESGGGTSTVVVVDRKGVVATLTQTLGGTYGNGVRLERYGTFLNGIASYFAEFDPLVSKSRRMAPKERLPWCLALMSVRKNNKLLAHFGTPGGHMIPQMELQLFLNHFVFGRELREALDAPRFGLVGENALKMEQRYHPETITQLSSMGYKVDLLGDYSWFMGNMQGVSILGKDVTLVGDRRRHSVALSAGG